MEQKDINIIIDFDSTFVKLEGLEELAKISLNNNPLKDEIIEEIEQITNLGMSGDITFQESLKSRLNLFKPSMSDLEELIVLLKSNITKSIHSNKQFFIANSQRVYIISGGFNEWIYPVVKDSGILSTHILSNNFILKNDNIIGINEANPLTRTGGKYLCVKNLKLTGVSVMIGDGYTDYEVKENGAVEKFIMFVENVRRPKVESVADYIAMNWDEVLKYINSIT